jgi:hypothetical protein
MEAAMIQFDYTEAGTNQLMDHIDKLVYHHMLSLLMHYIPILGADLTMDQFDEGLCRAYIFEQLVAMGAAESEAAIPVYRLNLADAATI